MRPLAVAVLLIPSLAAVEVARAQPLVTPSAPLATTAGPATGLALTSPWLRTGWDDGLAEVAEYDLQQFRYGNLHPGAVTLVAVREAMDAARAVKALPGAAPTVPVLKLHAIRSFQTGVYRYDQSSFQLVRQNDGIPLRWLITSHEWCGAASKSWVNGGPLTVSSYFDGHGDVRQPLDLGTDAVPADSLWWWARAWVAAGSPATALRIIPSQLEARCIDTTPQAATIAAAASGQGRVVVTLRRDHLVDRLTIAADPPYALQSWEQADGSVMTLRRLRRFDYWAHHDPADRPAQP